MELNTHVLDLILNADGKAIATTGPHGLNVVPLSTVRVVEGRIWLMNYFLKKTLENIEENPRVAFVSWRGLDGVQVKGHIEYLDNGDTFEEARAWVTSNVPNRTLKGLLILTPEEVYSVAPGL
jgi:predicted pyridoxine 5'-phosphate oxidase superfamily flavin-nucleotide-binding protein